MEQIEQMATNHFPHMQQSLTDPVEKHKATNKLLEKQSEVLSEISANIKVLVDRGVRL